MNTSVAATLLLLTTVGVSGDGPLAPEQLRDALRTLRLEGNNYFHARQYRDAIRVYEQGYREATRAGDTYSAARFLLNAGSARFATLEYREAMRALVEARRTANAGGDMEAAGLASCNLSSLYLQLGDLNAGLGAAQDGLAALRRHGRTKHLADLLAQAGLLHARSGDMASAGKYFREAIAAADGLAEKRYVLAHVWDNFGYEVLERGHPDEAETAFLEAFRIRKLGGLSDIQYSFYGLGMVELARGRNALARRHFSNALSEAMKTPGGLPLWRIWFQRGRALRTLGRAAEALDDFRAALDSVRRWRIELVPADSLSTNAAVEVQQVYSAFIETANSLYFRTRDAGLLEQAFHAAEESRAAGLRALLYSPLDWQERLPADYWETLSEVRAAEIAHLGGDAGARDRIRRLLFRLTEREAAAGLDFHHANPAAEAPGETNLLRATRDALKPDEAFLSFHLGQRESYVWALTREDFELRSLPAASQIASAADRFREAVRLGRPDSEALGAELYSALFGGLRGGALRKPRWRMALDSALFGVPFGALVAGRLNGRPVYFIERHAAQIVPDAFGVPGRTRQRWTGRFVGVADAVYNRADPRWLAAAARDGNEPGFWKLTPRLFARGGSPAPLEMARLAASGAEVRRCADAWTGGTGGALLLEGPAASRERLLDALQVKPSILHFAAHFVVSSVTLQRGAWPAMDGNVHATAGRSGQAAIGLSLTREGRVDLLSPTEISRWRRPADLVVLSGCASGLAETLPGNGLMGMARAWLAAGAGSVAATLWPTPDDSGEMLASFYRHLRALAPDSSAAPAAALHKAQSEMLRSATWRAEPRYWAAYFVFGKE